ncbi:MAG TPA: guanylate kinase [Candidatus Baltobacteraceae bacterium]|jgi:guanylate kinase|nr:guanylate kinase [Candidatus Baltobacteraceae bacterium]
MEGTLHGPGLLFVVSGPSGAGKDTVVEAVMRRHPRLRYSVSATTRAPRAGEREGEAYFFIDRTTFEKRQAVGDFLEVKEYNGNLYGTPRAYVEETLASGYGIIAKPEVNGALEIKKAFPAAVLIFLLPDRFSYLRVRLLERRTESTSAIAERLAIAEEELRFIREFDYAVINAQADVRSNDQLPAVADLTAIIRADQLRIHHYDERFLQSIRES